ncbi:MAG: DUF1501 domain-containing protein [Planctomycetota bacterium]
MNPIDVKRQLDRRAFFSKTGASLGAIALGSLLQRDGFARPDEALKAKAPKLKAKAKQVIFLEMAGAPPQLDMFDHKPELDAHHGKKCPDSFIEGRRLAFIKGHPTLLGSQYPWRRVGETGRFVTSLLPHFESIADKVTMIHSMHTDQFNHAPADLLMFTGNSQFGAAAMGSWITYGLGALNQNLPAFVVLGSGGSDPTGGKSVWGSGFLPSFYQGVRCRSVGDPILYVSDPSGMSRDVRRRSLDTLNALNALDYERAQDPEIQSRIEQYELAFRMQAAVPQAMDIANEPESIRAMYGAEPGKGSFANNCLLARRLVERGVRFVQVFDWGWDIHGTGPGDDLMTAFPKKCADIDQPIAALVKDLEQRGLLDETLVVWGGEFGRTSMNEARNGSTFLGRDHHPDCFTMWMAGGGVKEGFTFGATDELGYTIAEDPMSVRDLQATILHALGLDPYLLRYPFQGLEQRLIGPTDEANVRLELFA